MMSTDTYDTSDTFDTSDILDTSDTSDTLHKNSVMVVNILTFDKQFLKEFLKSFKNLQLINQHFNKKYGNSIDKYIIIDMAKNIALSECIEFIDPSYHPNNITKFSGVNKIIINNSFRYKNYFDQDNQIKKLSQGKWYNDKIIYTIAQQYYNAIFDHKEYIKKHKRKKKN